MTTQRKIFAINSSSMNVKNRTMIVAIAIIFTAGILMSRADTHYVSLAGTNDIGGGYTSWSGAATQIQWAVDASAASDTVLVSNGTYNLTNQISIAKAITVRSLYGTNDINTSSIINGNNYAGKPVTNRCVYMSAGVLDGFIISNGYYVVTADLDGGGGIFAQPPGGGSVTVQNCIICWNTAYAASKVDSLILYSGGGGVHMRDPGCVVSNCIVISNTANYLSGGGIYGYNMTPVGIVASRISGEHSL